MTHDPSGPILRHQRMVYPAVDGSDSVGTRWRRRLRDNAKLAAMVWLLTSWVAASAAAAIAATTLLLLWAMVS